MWVEDVNGDYINSDHIVRFGVEEGAGGFFVWLKVACGGGRGKICGPYKTEGQARDVLRAIAIEVADLPGDVVSFKDGAVRRCIWADTDVPHF